MIVFGPMTKRIRTEALEAKYKASRKFDEATDAEIARLRRAGATIEQLKEQFDGGLWSIYSALKRCGIEMRSRGEPLTKKERELIKQMNADNRIASDIARDLNRPLTTVLYEIKKLGLPMVPRRGPNADSWKGGRYFHKKSGYMMVWIGDDDPLVSMRMKHGEWAHGGYAPEHRIVMARHLGHPLDPHETVHHINGISTDNRIENLQLRQGRHGKGVVMRCRSCGSHDIESARIAAA